MGRSNLTTIQMCSPFREIFLLFFLVHSIDAGGFKQKVKDKPYPMNSQHILFLVSKYLNIYDFHNFLLLNRRAFNTLPKYVEEIGIMLDIQTFSGVHELLFEHFSAYCASMFVLSSQKRIEMEGKTYLLYTHKKILITPKKLMIYETPRFCDNTHLGFFPLYAFTFKEKVYVLSDLELVERKNLLRLEYFCQNSMKILTLAATIEYSYQKLEENTLTFASNSIYKLAMFSFNRNRGDVEPIEEVFFDFFPGDHNIVKIPCISKTIILNQNTCKNLYQKSQKQKQENLSRGVQSCLPIGRFFRK